MGVVVAAAVAVGEEVPWVCGASLAVSTLAPDGHVLWMLQHFLLCQSIFVMSSFTNPVVSVCLCE